MRRVLQEEAWFVDEARFTVSLVATWRWHRLGTALLVWDALVRFVRLVGRAQARAAAVVGVRRAYLRHVVELVTHHLWRACESWSSLPRGAALRVLGT